MTDTKPHWREPTASKPLATALALLAVLSQTEKGSERGPSNPVR